MSARVLVFDSGIGGLSVFGPLRAALPAADFVYVADDAAFPYGAWEEWALVEHVVRLMERLIVLHRPDVVVIACNTASTLVLPPLRERFTVPFVGTVPAVKPAAEQSRSRLASVLATPGTVKRDYTRALIATHGGDCAFTLVGSDRLAAIAEAKLAGETLDEAAIAAEIAPCFVEWDGRRTDTVALACTHYPFLLAEFEKLAPWPVAFIDPAPAIARRAVQVLADRGLAAPGGVAGGGTGLAVFTSGRVPSASLSRTLAGFGLAIAAPDAPPGFDKTAANL